MNISENPSMTNNEINIQYIKLRNDSIKFNIGQDNECNGIKSNWNRDTDPSYTILGLISSYKWYTIAAKCRKASHDQISIALPEKWDTNECRFQIDVPHN